MENPVITGFPGLLKSFPLNRSRGFAGDVVDDAVDAGDFAYDAADALL